MPNQSPSLAVINERLNTAIKIGSGAVVVASLVAVYFLTRVNDHGEKLATLQQTLKGMVEERRKDLPDTIGNLLRKGEKTKAAIGERGAVAADLIGSARARKLKSDPQLLKKVSTQLSGLQSQYPDVASLWQAGAQLVSYRSSGRNFEPVVNGGDSSKGSESQFYSIDCTKQTPHAIALTSAAKKGDPVFVDTPLRWENCEVSLDTPAAIAAVQKALVPMQSPQGLNPPEMMLLHCIVRYSGGALPFKGTLYFRDCLFVLAYDNIPSSPGQSFTQLAEASDAQSFVFRMGT